MCLTTLIPANQLENEVIVVTIGKRGVKIREMDKEFPFTPNIGQVYLCWKEWDEVKGFIEEKRKEVTKNDRRSSVGDGHEGDIQ